jgi:hypothetical protein
VERVINMAWRTADPKKGVRGARACRRGPTAHRSRPCLELTLAQGLVENARRIASLLAIVQRWKTSEVAFDGDVLSRQQLATFLAKLDRVRLCWLRRKAQGQNACRRSCKLGCQALRIEPSQNLGYCPSSEHPWFAVGHFDGERVFVDKHALRDRSPTTATLPPTDNAAAPGEEANPDQMLLGGHDLQ